MNVHYLYQSTLYTVSIIFITIRCNQFNLHPAHNVIVMNYILLLLFSYHLRFPRYVLISRDTREYFIKFNKTLEMYFYTVSSKQSCVKCQKMCIDCSWFKSKKYTRGNIIIGFLSSFFFPS